jgi:hypothetical protein
MKLDFSDICRYIWCRQRVVKKMATCFVVNYKRICKYTYIVVIEGRQYWYCVMRRVALSNYNFVSVWLPYFIFPYLIFQVFVINICIRTYCRVS